MSFQPDTPSSILYADLRSFGGISNADAARILLSDKVSLGRKPLHDRLNSRTFLSREVVHVQPSQVNPSLFADFAMSAQTICSRIVAYVGGATARAAVVEHYSGAAALEMRQALSAFGIDEGPYRSEVSRLLGVRLRREQDRSLLLVMLFCVTGCLAQPVRAVEAVEAFARNKLAQDLATLTSDYEGGTPSPALLVEEGAVQLGLLREIDGMAMPPLYPLNPEGTEIGLLATGQGAITSVAPDVSRRHARIWRQDGRWLCAGLGSTNGTAIRSGATGALSWVEPPRSQRQPGACYPAQELRESDTLCLGGSTRFLVLRVRQHS